jgi:NAD(P)-dependent dehydrogenase (short-subunit alcohol dehydrogenase family)
MVDKTLKRFSRIDILVNNAGITIVKPFEEFSEEEWDRVLGVNLKGVFLCSQLVGKQMIKQGRGKIINLSSIVGEIALPRRSAYCVSKAAIMFIKVLAVEWAKYNINVNAIGPGYVETEMVASLVREGVVDRERLKKRYLREDLLPQKK